MWTQRITSFACLSLFALSATCFAAAAHPYKQLVIFGDSYSDNGNTFQASKNTYPGPAYYLGRFSNGTNWTEYLAARMGFDFVNATTFRNYAYGQAQVLGDVSFDTYHVDNPKKTWQFTVPDLSNQVSQYFQEGSVDASNSLYIIFIGTNDFLNHNPTGKTNNKKIVTTWLKALHTQVSRLKKAGATHIVLFTIRDLQRSPLAKSLAAKYQNNYTAKLNTMITQFNTALLTTYKNSNIVRIYDVYGFDQTLFSKQATYTWYRETMRLNEKTAACYVNHGNYIDTMGPACDDAWGYVFYDRIHLTTAANKLMSDTFYEWVIKR